MIFPNKLKKGDTVGLLSPSGYPANSQLHLVSEAVSLLKSWGLEVQLQPGYDNRHFYLAGTDEHRAEHFQSFYTDPQIKALFFTRGGYGASRLYRYLDDDLISKHQKIVVGLSDVTSLLLYLYKVCQMVVFHGPNLASSTFLKKPLKEQTQESLYNHLFSMERDPVSSELPSVGISWSDNSRLPSVFRKSVLKKGYGKGLLIGGNLSLVVTTLGTPYEIETKGNILFLEDVNEKPYRIDRMLTHMRNAGKLEGIQGIVFGEMVGCYDKDDLLWKMLEDFFKDDPFPVMYGLPSGHGDYSLTLPLGVEVELDTDGLRYC